MPFQHYFVRRRCEPVVKGIRFHGAAAATPSPGVLELLSNPAVRAIVICPSNPYLSVDPILSVPGIREALANSGAPVIAVSPIIGGQAVKGPTAKIMRELGVAVNTQTIAAHYRGLIDGLVIDEADARRRNPDRRCGHGDADDDEGSGGSRAARRRGRGIRRRLVAPADDGARSRWRPMNARADIWAIVPVKRFALAKRRLAPVLGAGERAHLARLMLEDVLDALARCRSHLAGIVVVTADAAAAALAERHNAKVASDTGRHGINAAIRLGLDCVIDNGGAGVLIVPSDVPHLSPGDVTQASDAIRASNTARRHCSDRRWRHQSAGMPSGERAPAVFRPA